MVNLLSLMLGVGVDVVVTHFVLLVVIFIWFSLTHCVYFSYNYKLFNFIIINSIVLPATNYILFTACGTGFRPVRRRKQNVVSCL